MSKELIKGNEAIVKGAILAGCRAYFGYPITPASEIAEAAAYYFPLVGGTFLQAESEVASINMIYGASSTGLRCMTGSSGPGISLMQEGISYLAGSELPCVIADVMRGGPGLGNIGPEQGDYNQMVKGGGHGNYHNIVLAPNSAQEMCDLTMLAFELADKYRNPAIVLADGYIGQMMEPVDFPETAKEPPVKDWAAQGMPRPERMCLRRFTSRMRRWSSMSCVWLRNIARSGKTKSGMRPIRWAMRKLCWWVTASFRGC